MRPLIIKKGFFLTLKYSKDFSSFEARKKDFLILCLPKGLKKALLRKN